MALRPFIIDTSDKRCRYLFDMLQKKGFKVKENVGCEIDTYEACILIFPPAKKIEVKDIDKLKKGSAVFGGNAAIEAKKQMSLKGIAYFNILQDEKFTVRNTVPTALGCIYVLMENSTRCINEKSVLVLGYGRVAKTLVKYLRGIDAAVSVYTADEKERAQAEIFASGTLSDLMNIGGYDVIINTVPAKLLTNDIISTIKNNAFVCDLASGDFVDIARLEKRNIRAVKAAALPGKVAPESAAAYMEECILDTLNKNSGLRSVFLVQ